MCTRNICIFDSEKFNIDPLKDESFGKAYRKFEA